MERGAIQVKRNNDTGKEMWRPMPRKDLMNRSDAEDCVYFQFRNSRVI